VRPYSDDLRERVVEAVQSGASRREAAERFEISPSSAIKWLQRWRETGSVAVKPSGGSISPLEKHATQLLSLLAEQPDRTLEEVVEAMQKQRIVGSLTAVWRFFKRHEISFKKKSLRAAEQEREDVARARRRWIRRQGFLDTTALVFLDETAVSTNMVRLCGRCPRGERLIGRVPQGNWQTITLVAGLRHSGMVAPLVIDGPMDGPTFVAYVDQCLAPTLARGEIVILDNLTCHKVSGVKEAIEAVGAKVMYLPQYSPDLNPIEEVFSKIKALLRKAAERTVPRLHRRIAELLDQVSAQECSNFFEHAGYAST
jgi:transposase